MNTLYLLLAQFESTTLTIDQVCTLLGGKAHQTIRNRVSAGTFPRPTSDSVWHIQDIADYLDATRNAPRIRNAA